MVFSPRVEKIYLRKEPLPQLLFRDTALEGGVCGQGGIPHNFRDGCGLSLLGRTNTCLVFLSLSSRETDLHQSGREAL